VLIVDDELLIRWAVKSGLQQAGFATIEAGSAAAALAEVRRPDNLVDLVLLDLKLPDSDDLSLLRLIREACPGCPVLMMTAYATPETKRDALLMGAHAVVGKPFNIDEVVAIVDQTLGPAPQP
jgi:DNA-binding response OmpR family regulator